MGIGTCLWFDDRAEEAANFYVSLFKNSKIKKIARYNEASAKAARRAPGSVMTVSFEIEGREFLALNGGPVFRFTPAVSFVVNCKDQREVDLYWDKLGEGGEPSQCGWLTDKFGVSWQVIPAELTQIMEGPDAAKAARVMNALLQMRKPDVEKLKKAAAE